MQDATPIREQDLPKGSAREISSLQREIDERDETIRLLNEALSDALDQIESLAPRQVA